MENPNSIRLDRRLSTLLSPVLSFLSCLPFGLPRAVFKYTVQIAKSASGFMFPDGGDDPFSVLPLLPLILFVKLGHHVSGKCIFEPVGYKKVI